MTALALRRRTGSAFTLVEIVLALGLIAFAMVGIFGLLGAAAVSSGNSDRDTMFVSMTSQVMNDLRAVPFDTLWNKEPRLETTSPVQPQVHSSTPEETYYYFTSEGSPLEGSPPPANPPAGAVYLCTVMKSEDLTSIGYKLASNEGAGRAGKSEVNALNLKLIFKWPAGASKGQTFTTYAKIARY